MNRKMRVVPFLWALLLVPASLSADNTTAASSRALPLGVAVKDTVPGSGFQWYDVQLVTGRSYQYLAWDPSADMTARGLYFVSLFHENGTTPAGGTLGGYTEPHTIIGQGSQSVIPTERPCPTTNCGTRFKLRVQNVLGTDADVMVAIFETTLSSPWFFRDSSYDGFVEVRNHTDTSQQVFYRVYSLSGTLLCSVSDALPANGGNVFGVGDRCGLANAMGSVQIAHSGAPGAITANITSLSAATGLSFDAPFTPRHVYAGFTIH